MKGDHMSQCVKKNALKRRLGLPQREYSHLFFTNPVRICSEAHVSEEKSV